MENNKILKESAGTVDREGSEEGKDEERDDGRR